MSALSVSCHRHPHRAVRVTDFFTSCVASRSVTRRWQLGWHRCNIPLEEGDDEKERLSSRPNVGIQPRCQSHRVEALPEVVPDLMSLRKRLCSGPSSQDGNRDAPDTARAMILHTFYTRMPAFARGCSSPVISALSPVKTRMFTRLRMVQVQAVRGKQC
ncbi:hypothetical protein LZ30DRAFT_166667 [Colletotrichum cereale]|nr:hypothetical protein LZ30DRAFT_166667 [Colletotrichum cereale]